MQNVRSNGGLDSMSWVDSSASAMALPNKCQSTPACQTQRRRCSTFDEIRVTRRRGFPINAAMRPWHLSR